MNRAGLATLALILAPLAGADAHPGIGIVMDHRGNVFYTDLAQVWMIAPDGSRTVAVAGVHTHELNLDEEGNLYGEHLWYEGDATGQWGHRVWRRSPDGRLSDILPATRGFRTDYSFVRDSQGAMYWAQRDSITTIRRRGAEGRISTVTSGGLRDVRWMTAAPDGTLYLIDLSDLKRISADGRVTTLATGLGARRWSARLVDERHLLMGLTVDRTGNAFVAAYGDGTVKRVAPDGSVTVVAKAHTPWAPSGVMVAPDGTLWVLETSLVNAVRVRHFRADGKIEVWG